MGGGGLRSEVTVNSGTFVGGLLHAPWVGGSPSPSAWPRPQRRPRPLAWGGGGRARSQGHAHTRCHAHTPFSHAPQPRGAPWRWPDHRSSAVGPRVRAPAPAAFPPPRTPPSSAPTTPISAPVVPNGGRPNPSVLSVLFLFTVWSPPGGWGGAEGRITLPAAVLHAARRTQNHLFL